MSMTLTEYVDKYSDILSSTRHKNPLFYMLVTAKLKFNPDVTSLQTDFTLKQAFAKAEELTKKLGRTNVKVLSDNWTAGIVMIKFEESTKSKPENVVKKILTEMRKYLMALATDFSKAYEIEQSFKEYENSKEIEDFFVSIRR